MTDLAGQNSVTGDDELRKIIDYVILSYSRTEHMTLADRADASRRIFASIRGYDVLQELIDDPGITEIMVNGPEEIFVEREGSLSRAACSFESPEKLYDVIQKIASGANRLINEASPIVDARLPDGSRVNMILPPVAVKAPVITIRKFPPDRITAEKLIEFGSMTREVAAFLRALVRAGYNILVSGGTGSGKTTFLNVLSDYIPGDERIVTIEDSAELKITHIPNLVSLEVRNANIEGRNAIGIRELIRTSLRMRPDRIIVGEIRGGEAIDMLQAMNTGHDGSLSTGHANSATDMLSRIETMVLLGSDIPLTAVRRQIASAVDIIIQLSRFRDKSRKIDEIVEVTGCREDGEIGLSTLFKYVEEGEEEGRVIGRLVRENALKRRDKLERAGLSEIPAVPS